MWRGLRPPRRVVSAQTEEDSGHKKPTFTITNQPLVNFSTCFWSSMSTLKWTYVSSFLEATGVSCTGVKSMPFRSRREKRVSNTQTQKLPTNHRGLCFLQRPGNSWEERLRSRRPLVWAVHRELLVSGGCGGSSGQRRGKPQGQGREACRVRAQKKAWRQQSLILIVQRGKELVSSLRRYMPYAIKIRNTKDILWRGPCAYFQPWPSAWRGKASHQTVAAFSCTSVRVKTKDMKAARGNLSLNESFRRHVTSTPPCLLGSSLIHNSQMVHYVWLSFPGARTLPVLSNSTWTHLMTGVYGLLNTLLS